MLTPETQIRINMLNVKDYINLRLTANHSATNVLYENVRALNIKGGGNFQQALHKLDSTFDFRFEPSKNTLIKFKEKYLN